MSGHSDIGISNNLEASIFTWYKQILLRNLAVLRWYPWLLLLSFVMLMILVQWMLRKTPNHLLQYHLGVQLDPCFLLLFLQFGIFQMTYVHQWGEMNFCALRPCFINHLFLTSDLGHVPRQNLQASLGFLWSFCFTRKRLDPLSGRVLHHDCKSVIVSRFTIFTENLVICCYQVTKICSSKYASAIASSARSPCNLGPLTDLAISVFREVSTNTVLTQILSSRRHGL